MIVIDTDGDDLSDYDEVATYKTDPLKPDTDGDGVDDGVEIAIGSDPLKAETKFETKLGTNRIANGDAEAVDILVKMTGDADSAGSLSIVPLTRADNALISNQIPGYLGAAYEISADASFDSAVIEFSYGKDVGILSGDFQPRIYYLNEETGEFEELENQTVSEGKVTATISHFSVYMLLNKFDFEEVWNTEIKPPLSGDNNSISDALDIVFVIDYSLSMEENDPRQIFKTLSKNFLAKLRDNKDQAAVVKFIRIADVIISLTHDKTVLNSAIDSINYDNGYGYYSGTDGSAGINSALNILETSSVAKYKYIIFITDGQDNGYSYSYDSLILRANNKNIIIYTIGIGDASESILKKVASETGGKYYKATASDGVDDIAENIQELDNVFEEIESETVDLTKDDNNDGIPDYYAELMNSGKLRLSNGTAWLVGVLDMYGDSSDWDGDGLKNGEEIEISGSYYSGKVYIKMKSDPLVYDSDFDGYSDYDEVKTMKTSPLKPTKPSPDATANAAFNFNAAATINNELKNLLDDSNFPEEKLMKYLDFSVNKHVMQHIFDRHKTEEVKNALIDYFYNYATGANINADAAARAAMFARTADILGAVSDIAGAVKDVKDCAETIGTLGYADSAIQRDITKANKARESAQKVETKINEAKKSDIDFLNKFFKTKKSQQKAENFIKNAAKSESVLKDIINDMGDFAEFKQDVNDFSEQIQATDWNNISLETVIDLTTNGASKAAKFTSAIASAVDSVGTIVKHAAKAEKIRDWKIPFRSKALRESAVKSGSNVGEAIGTGFTIVTNLVDTASDVLDTLSMYSKIEANYAEYQKYTDLLRYIENNQEFESYVRHGAQYIAAVFDENNDVDWAKFHAQVIGACAQKIVIGTINTVVDIASNAYPILKLINTSYKLVKAGVSLIGVTERAKVIVAAQAYYSVTDGSRRLLNKIITFKNKYYEFDDENQDDVDKYIIQLAQSRIAGLFAVMEYIAGDSPAAWFDRGGVFYDKTQEQIKADYKTAAEEIYEVAAKCAVVLSKNLPKF